MEKRTVSVRNMTLGDGIPKICIPMTAGSFGGMEEQLEEILRSPCDMVEWRADYFEDGLTDNLDECFRMLRDRLGEKPLLFTYRTAAEGGNGRRTGDAYEELNVRAAESGMADFVDLEWNRGEALFGRTAEKVHQCGALVVGSFHDFGKTPEEEELVRILCGLQKLGADVSKAAVMPQCERDVITLLSASLAMKERYADRPYITMSMGRLGSFTRLSGSFTGSALTFATAGPSSAPGQMDARMVAEVLKALRTEMRTGA